MVQYNLRTHDGFLKAVVPSAIALEMIGGSTGKWNTAPDGSHRHILQFTDDRAAICKVNTWSGPFGIVFASGDYIEVAK